MWEPDLAEGGSRLGTRMSAWEGDSGLSAIAILDPPRNAMPSDAYARARESVARIAARIPGDQRFAVGFQQDLFVDAVSVRDRFAEIPSAAAGTSLEEDWVVREYHTLQSRAVAAMSAAAPLAAALSEAHATAVRRVASPTLAAMLARPAAAEGQIPEDPPVALKLKKLRELAAAADVVSSASDRALFDAYERLRGFETTGPPAELLVTLRDVLIGQIHQAALHPPDHAPWEVLRAALARDASGDRSVQIAEIDGHLAADVPPPPSDDARRALDEAVKYACMPDMIRVQPGVDKRHLLGAHGEQISHLVELSGILGLDNLLRRMLSHYVHYRGAEFRLNQLTRGLVARHLGEAIQRLERDVCRGVCESDADRALLGLAPAMKFLDAIGRYQIVHDEQLRQVILRLDLAAVGEALERTGATLPAGWRRDAAGTADALAVLRQFYDATILRAKDLARALATTMTKEDARRGVMYVDGYLSEAITRWLESHQISYVCVIPKW